MIFAIARRTGRARPQPGPFGKPALELCRNVQDWPLPLPQSPTPRNSGRKHLELTEPSAV